MTNHQIQDREELEELTLLKDVSKTVFNVYAKRIREKKSLNNMNVGHAMYDDYGEASSYGAAATAYGDDASMSSQETLESALDPALGTNVQPRSEYPEPPTEASQYSSESYLETAPTTTVFTAEDPSLPTSTTAAELKRKYNEASGQSAAGRRLIGEHDPENREIKRLRQDEDLDFEAIAQIINKQRFSKGMKGDLTANAVYGRYKRNAPLIAMNAGQDFAPTIKDQKHSQIKFMKAETIRGFDANEDALLVQAHHQIREEFWTLVAQRIAAMGGRMHEPELCAKRFEKI